MKKTVSWVMLIPLLVCVVTLVFHAQSPYMLQTSSEVQSGGISSAEQKVIALVNGSRAYEYDLELERIASRHYAFRAGGSPGAYEAANWIKSQFDSFGLEAWLEPFEFTTWDLLSKPSLLIDVDGNQSTTYDQTMISSFQSTHCSWPTPENGSFADLVILPLPYAADRNEIGKNPIDMTAWDAINTTGKILLIGKEVRWAPNWLHTFFDKLIEQPPAAVVYTWWYDWMSFTPPMFGSAGGRIYWDLELPVGFVNYEDGLWIRSSENTMNVSAHVSVRSAISTGTHYNVVGKITGYRNPEKLVIISGHYDTVMCGGFCDNGAGTAGVMEIAKVFAEATEKGFYRPSYTLLFVAFASEELWLVGSINYVIQHKSEMANISAVINLDCVGSDELYVTETNPVNGFDLDQTILDAAQDLGITVTLEKPGASDHETFRNPSWANDLYYDLWGLEANISDATPVESSVMFDSYPLLYSDMWSMGTPGWIHTSYDNSTSTQTLNWVETEDLENHIKVAALTAMRISPDTCIIVPDDYSTIQAAINAANPRDTVYVRNGTYYENVVVNKTVSLIGENKTNTIIDGMGQGFVVVVEASNVTLSGFTIRRNAKKPPSAGILFFSSSNNTVVDNDILDNWNYGIWLEHSSNVRITNNNVSSEGWYGISLFDSNNITIISNYISDTQYGISLFYSNNTMFIDNYITRTPQYGITFDHSNNNLFVGSNISSSISVDLSYSYNNTFSRNNITNSHNCGVRLSHSSNNSLFENNIKDNSLGIYLNSSSNNKIYHNNFVNNTKQVYSEDSTNNWNRDYPSGGNYWSNYTNADLYNGPGQNITGSDGIGDSAHIIDGNNRDLYPLMAPIGFYEAGISIISNSTITVFELSITEKTLSFTVTEADLTRGFCRVIIPNDITQSLWNRNYSVLFDGEPVEFRNWTDPENTYIYFNYTHSPHQVTIIPEFPSNIILPLFTLTTIIVTIITKKKRRNLFHIP